MAETMENANQLLDKFMNLIIDYDSYCETEENEVQRRREQAELNTYTDIQSKLNTKVTGKMKEQPMVQMLAKHIHNIYD